MMMLRCREPLAVVVACSFLWATVLSTTTAHAQVSQRNSPAPPGADPLTSRLELMLRAMRIARDWHVETPGKPALVAGAIEGLLSRVDPEAELYTRRELRQISRFAPGNSAGLGIEVRREPAQRRNDRPGYRVITTRDGGSAALAGIKAGDLITHIDGRPAGDIPHLAMKHIKLDGAPGTQVRLVVERSGGDGAPEELFLTRAVEQAPSLVVDEVAPGIIRVRMAELAGDTVEGLENAFSALTGTGGVTGYRGVVLDLRSTVGASVDTAGAIADAFLESGPVVRTMSRAKDSARTAEARPGDFARGRPLVVLVDAGTAGAAEMLAAALHEGRRARLVGTRTAGRGALRTLVPLDKSVQKGLLRITTERMLTPAGAPIDGKGLLPDMVVEQTPAHHRCRSLDVESATQPGRCVPRSFAEDGQLARAISLLGEPIVAAGQSPATPKP
jgi:carboxyl-terminal processing protease